MLGNNLLLFYAAFSSALSDHLSICPSFFLFDKDWNLRAVQCAHQLLLPPVYLTTTFRCQTKKCSMYYATFSQGHIASAL